MINKKFVFALFLILSSFPAVFAQTQPSGNPVSDPKLSDKLSKNADQLQNADVPRERREQAYAKLLEAQRYIWSLSRQRSQSAINNTAKLAKQALQKAVELDPNLAEGYTALAELTLTTPPNDLEEAIMLANIAVKIDAGNYGGHRLLARLYTIKSGLNGGKLNAEFTNKAIAEWKEIARLDPRNAEAFAFLSEFYAETNKPNERIEALKNWLSSATPLETRFYRTIMGAQEELSPEAASLKLGEALIESGDTREAVEVLSRAVADNPDNPQAVELLKEAIESANSNALKTAVENLRQAVFANPDNASLIVLLAQVEARTGKIEDAAKVLLDASARFAREDKNTAAGLQLALGDIYASADHFNEAIAVYQNALAMRGIEKNQLVTDDDRNFAITVFDKMINTYKKANRPNDAKAVIDRARILLGDNDLFADKQLISLYRETGKKQEALQTIRSMRVRNPGDYGLLRLEASILTDSGKVDEAVALIKNLINKKVSAQKNENDVSKINVDQNSGTGTFSIQPPVYDKFINYLYISNLYSQAKRGKEAVEAANQAYEMAQDSERRQIAKLTLATAHQMSGDYEAAEKTLRALLEQTPRNPIALNNLGYFLVERNEKLDEALDLIQQALKIDPTNPSYLDSLGWTYFKLGKYNEAEKYLKTAARNDSSSATIQEHLGDVYQKQNKIDLAKNAWQKALNLVSDAEDINRLKAKLNVKAAK